MKRASHMPTHLVVARHVAVGRVVHECGRASQQAVEERRFAHVGAADNCDLGCVVGGDGGEHCWKGGAVGDRLPLSSAQ
eukprot:364671-Chlamydomonas_euryale.AAC.3